MKEKKDMEKGKISVATVAIALIGVFLCGVGLAFNNCAGLGNDSVGIFYDGIRVFLGLSTEQLGIATNIVNLTLLIVVFFMGRRYLSIGTFIYLIPYGFCVSAGTAIYSVLSISDAFPIRVIFAFLGSFLICAGVALFITVDIGVDPMTGVVLILADKLKKEYRIVKIGYDLTLLVLGFFLGGKIGVVTLVTGFCIGPCIQFLNHKFENCLFKNTRK